MNDVEYDLELDLKTTDWILQKIKSSDVYAQNLYAAFCNNDFQKLEVIPILKDKKWHVSWRSAGGVIADLREEGDYLDWYCSGMTNPGHDAGGSYDYEPNKGYVAEGTVTEEIRTDLKKLGWIVVDNQS